MSNATADTVSYSPTNLQTLSTDQLRTKCRERCDRLRLPSGSKRWINFADKPTCIDWLLSDSPEVLPGSEAAPAPAAAAPAAPGGGALESAIAAAAAASLDTEAGRVVVRRCVDDVVKGLLESGAIGGFGRVTINLPERPEPVELEGALHGSFSEVLEVVRCDIPCYIYGPAGSGKTTLAEQVATALGLQFGHVSLTLGVSETALLGRIVPQGDGWNYQASSFVECYRDGGVFLFDEIDGADENMLLIVNSALANGKLYIPTANLTVKRHKDFRAIAAGNTRMTGGDAKYNGRGPKDRATVSRWQAGYIKLDRDEKLERAIVTATLGQATDGDELAVKLLSWAGSVRSVIESDKLAQDLDMRYTINTAVLLAGGRSWESCMRSFFGVWSEDETRRLSADLREGVL